MKPINPPAIVREVVSLKERAERVKEMHRTHIRTTLEDAIAIGKELREARDQCTREGRGWYEWLAEAGISESTAKRNIRCYDNKDKLSGLPAIGGPCGIVEVLNWLSEQENPEQEESPPASEQQTEEQPATQPPVAPPETIFCRNCRVNGPAKDCKECKAWRKAAKDANAREPGDDTETEEKARRADSKAKQTNGKPVFEWRDYENVFGPVARTPNKIVEAYPQEKQSPEYAEAMKLLTLFAEVMKTWKNRLAKGA